MTVSTESLAQQIRVLLLVRQLAVAVDVGQLGQPLVQHSGPLTVKLTERDGRGRHRHVDRKYFTSKTSFSSRLSDI